MVRSKGVFQRSKTEVEDDCSIARNSGSAKKNGDQTTDVASLETINGPLTRRRLTGVKSAENLHDLPL
jgi:hypothetical protein